MVAILSGLASRLQAVLTEFRRNSCTIGWAIAVLVATAGWLYFIARVTYFLVNTPPAKAGGFRLRLEAGLVRPLADSDGGCASSYLGIIVRLWRCQVLDIFGPYLIGNVSAAGDPISSAP